MIEAAEALGEKRGVSQACRVLGVPRRTLYRARKPKEGAMGFLKDLAEAMDDEQDTTRKDPPYPKRPKDALRKYLPGIRVHLLTKASKPIDGPEARERYAEHRLQTFNHIVEHCPEARELDEAGRIDEAIEFYETNVAYFDISDDAYERLRTIYCERGQCEDALRAYRAYLETDDLYQQVLVGRP